MSTLSIFITALLFPARIGPTNDYVTIEQHVSEYGLRGNDFMLQFVVIFLTYNVYSMLTATQNTQSFDLST